MVVLNNKSFISYNGRGPKSNPEQSSSYDKKKLKYAKKTQKVFTVKYEICEW